jgi:hypothetical protein
LRFGFVFAQSQAACGHAPSLKPRQNAKFLAAEWTLFAGIYEPFVDDGQKMTKVLQNLYCPSDELVK